MMKRTRRKFLFDKPFVFELPMQIPSGKNAVQITRKGQRYPNKRFKAWRDLAMHALPGIVPAFEGPVAMVVDYIPGDKIRRDVPGILDALCHLVEKAGIVHDDTQIKNVAWTTFAVQPKRPQCRVSICPLAQEAV